MEDVKIVSGNTEQEIWPAIEADLLNNDVFNYNVLIRQGSKETSLYIDIDLGGGFEGGSEITNFKASLTHAGDFKFAIHDEDFIDQIGKFFGMQDIETGYEALDKHLIIKTNNEEKTKAVFADAEIRELFTSLADFDCGIHTHHEGNINAPQAFLELNINEGINDPGELRKIYHAFYKLLTSIDGEA